MVDFNQAINAAGTAAIQTLLPQRPAAPAPSVTYVQAPASSTNWMLWGGIALAGLVGLVVLKKTMGRGGSSSAPAAAPSATNPRRRRRKVVIHRRRR
jgi:LPXTG-motif cell wall-anchored protein